MVNLRGHPCRLVIGVSLHSAQHQVVHRFVLLYRSSCRGDDGPSSVCAAIRWLNRLAPESSVREIAPVSIPSADNPQGPPIPCPATSPRSRLSRNSGVGPCSDRYQSPHGRESPATYRGEGAHGTGHVVGRRDENPDLTWLGSERFFGEHGVFMGAMRLLL
jgi:hypothetical protein